MQHSRARKMVVQYARGHAASVPHRGHKGQTKIQTSEFEKEVDMRKFAQKELDMANKNTKYIECKNVTQCRDLNPSLFKI
eukprot:8758078-Karenia_brevis.AAC.1